MYNISGLLVSFCCFQERPRSALMDELHDDDNVVLIGYLEKRVQSNRRLDFESSVSKWVSTLSCCTLPVMFCTSCILVTSSLGVSQGIYSCILSGCTLGAIQLYHLNWVRIRGYTYIFILPGCVLGYIHMCLPWMCIREYTILPGCVLGDIQLYPPWVCVIGDIQFILPGVC